MIQDLKDLISIQLEVSNDLENFKKFKEVKHEDISSLIYMDSMMDMLRELITEGKFICRENNYRTFRLRICTEKENYFLYDASLKRINRDTPDEVKVPVKERDRYNTLSKREKEILCFLYRGYRQEDMAFIFRTNVKTIKKYRFNIYDKAGFRNKKQLAEWCEKYLNSVFKLKPSSEMAG